MIIYLFYMDIELPENFRSLREGKETANEYFEVH